jgi:hypothetical protein
MMNDEEVTFMAELNEGTRKLNYLIYMIRSLSMMNVSERPWNIKNQKTSKFKEQANIFLNDKDMFDYSFPEKEKPSITTLVNLMKQVHKAGLESATNYESRMNDYGDDIPRDKYTLLTDADDMPLEVSIDEFNMKVSS